VDGLEVDVLPENGTPGVDGVELDGDGVAEGLELDGDGVGLEGEGDGDDAGFEGVAVGAGDVEFVGDPWPLPCALFFAGVGPTKM
jgi:hypothetical protein